MRSGAVPLLVWGSLVVVLSLVGLLVFRLELLPFLLLAGAGLAAATWGAGTAALARRAPRPFCSDEARVVVDGSWAVVVACVGATIGVSGLLAFGMAFAFLGLALVALGVGGLVREARAERRAVRRLGGRAA